MSCCKQDEFIEFKLHFLSFVAFMKFFMETPENLTVFPGPKKAPGKSGCFMATSANTP